MRMYDIIERKRDGYELSKEEIDFVISSYTKGEIPDYQVSALLMAIYFQGMSEVESAHLTMAMAYSGHTLHLDSIPGIKVDKHSTGGVGDTTTIILIPLVASLGIPVPKMSGRGLGHTGGTVDKLEAIPGFNVEITKDQFIQIVKENNMAVIGQLENLAPADKLLYSLRDVTATVNSIPLIASSIMSKKIASGADKIVLDVKVGQGAFMKTIDEATELAKTMVKIGKRVNKETVAILTNMDQPLGQSIGNALEVKEAIETLQGKGPEDLTNLVIELGAYMAVLANKAESIKEAKSMLRENIENGKAINYLRKFITAQGGDPQVVDNFSLLPTAEERIVIKAKQEGYIETLVAHELGRAAMLLGAGRQTKDDVIDLAVGIELHKKVGDSVYKGEPICTIRTNKVDNDVASSIVEESIFISKEKQKSPLILDVFGE